MSWGMKFVAQDKARAKAEIDRIAAVANSVPQAFADGVKAQIDSMPVPPKGMGLLVESDGHIDPHYGSGRAILTFVQVLTFVLALLAPGFGAAQTPPPSPKYGGCLKNGTTCFAPTVSVSPLGLSLKDGAATVGVNLGVGYGVIVHSDQWWQYGLSLNVALRDTGDGQKPLVSVLGSFAEYLRLGLAYQIGGGSRPFRDSALVLLGIGADFGMSR